jgi:GTP cyclohydrolase IA
MMFDQNIDDVNNYSAINPHQRSISNEQMRKFEHYITEIFSALGLAIDTPGTYQTPQRFIQALLDVTEGYEGDAKLLTMFDAEYGDELDCNLSQIIEGPIPFFALCEHHALPFYGHAYVGYIAHKHIIGISKLTRLVRLFAKRFTMQERLGQQIADAFGTMLQPQAVAVYLEAHHLCMQMRGVQETESVTHTTCWRGEYISNAPLRVEFLLMCGADQS